uniref:Lipoprotein n=1 Tax=Tenacibaculum sp. Pbs-1 TaxID=3238748 RepID=A0AB33L1J5_9FLAO
MKMYFTKTKIALIFSLVLLSSFSSCSNSDDLASSNPFIEINWSNVGSSLSIRSDEFEEGGKLTFELYMNGQLKDSETITTGYEGGNNYNGSLYLDNTVSFPVTIYLVVKGGGSKTKSNEVVIEDPILGKRFLREAEVFDKLEETDIPMTLTSCEKLSTIEFFSNNKVKRDWFSSNSSTGECIEELEEFQWERVGVNKYKFIFDKNFYLVDMNFGYKGESIEFEVIGNRYDRKYYYIQ